MWKTGSQDRKADSGKEVRGKMRSAKDKWVYRPAGERKKNKLTDVQTRCWKALYLTPAALPYLIIRNNFSLQTVEDMVKMMEDKGNTKEANNTLKRELLLLSHEIHSTLTPPADSGENTTLVDFILETSAPVVNEPKDASGPTFNDTQDTSGHTFSNSQDTSRPTFNNAQDTTGPTFNNPEIQKPDLGTADAEGFAMAQAFLRRVKEVLEGSGIELVLPIDCGRVSLVLVTCVGAVASILSLTDILIYISLQLFILKRLYSLACLYRCHRSK